MTDWNKDRIAELRRVCGLLPEGPFIVGKPGPMAPVVNGRGIVVAMACAPGSGEFLAHARTALPAVLDEIERLQEQVDNLAGELAKMLVKKSEIQNERDEIAKSALHAVKQRDSLLARIRQHAHRLPPDIEAELEGTANE